MLKNYFKNLKTASYLSNKIFPEHSSRITYLFGNQSNDPDSVFGTVALSILLFIQKNSNKDNFNEFFDYLFSSKFDFKTLDSLLNETNFELYMPVLNTEKKDWVTSKLEIDYLNTRFDIGIEETEDLNHFQILKENDYIKFGLFDFNYPNKILDDTLKSITGEEQKLLKEIIIDHHALIDKKYPSTFKKTLIELSGSCHTLLYRYFSQSTILLLGDKCPDLLRLASLIIRIDSLNYAPELKGSKWVENDPKMSKKLAAVATYGNSEDDFFSYINHKYSMKQFNLEFERLFYADAKDFIYKGGHTVIYSVLFNSISVYLSHYGVDTFMDNLKKIAEKK